MGSQPRRDETGHELGGKGQWKIDEALVSTKCQEFKRVETSVSCSVSGNQRRLPGGSDHCLLPFKGDIKGRRNT